MGESVRSMKKLDNNELHILYCSLYISRMIISRKVKWIGHVAYMGTIKIFLKFWSDNMN
jgi:hypothetical protein